MRRWFASSSALPVALFLLLMALELGAILALNDGHLVYTLDDPYIHLALAENIARGQYGINLGEWSAPASSILWPFLLAPFAHSQFAAWVPLIINLGATLVTLVLVARAVDHRLAREPGFQGPLLASLLTTAFIPAANLIALAFTGMEHSLEVLLAVLIPLGIEREQESGRPPWWLLCAIAVGPMVRYEHLALGLPSLLYLTLRGHRRAAFLAALPVAIVLGGFSYFLHSKGLPLLPSSILSKSATAASHGSLKSIYVTLKDNLLRREGALLGLICATLGVILIDRSQAAGRRWLAGCIAAAGCIHLGFGAFGWFSRYEIYMWAASLVTLFVVFAGPIARYFTGRTWRWSSVVLAIFSFVVSFRYILTTVWTPRASNNIYTQQYQMHRFAATFYRGPVAVNDLGWVAYRNDNYVLDLWGLSSETARSEREQSSGSGWLDVLMRQQDVKLAMIYDDWLPEHPPTWRRLGELKLLRSRFTPASSEVAFYATDDSTFAEARKLLDRFRATLPPGAAFSFDAEPTGRHPIRTISP
jgi:hypothetical protein